MNSLVMGNLNKVLLPGRTVLLCLYKHWRGRAHSIFCNLRTGKQS